MGYSMDLFLKDQQLLDEFECSICHDVIKDPIMTEGCEHVFCTTCIQTWMTTSNTCPACRHAITGLRAPCRFYLNLYTGLKLKCCFDECDQVINLGQIEQHTKSCECNPEAVKLCPGNCGASIKMKEIPTHDSCEYLKSQLQDRDLKIVGLEEEIKLKNTETNLYLQYLGQKDDEINLIREGYIERIRSKDKESSDMLERKNDEIENIKKAHVEEIRSQSTEYMNLLERKNDEIKNIKKGFVEVIRSKDKLIEELKTNPINQCCFPGKVNGAGEAGNNSGEQRPAPVSRDSRLCRWFLKSFGIGFEKD